MIYKPATQTKPMYEIKSKDVQYVDLLPSKITCRTICAKTIVVAATSQTFQIPFELTLDDSLPKKIIIKNLSIFKATASTANQSYRIDLPGMCNFSLFLSDQNYLQQNYGQEFEFTNFNNISTSQILTLYDNSITPTNLSVSNYYIYITFEFFY